MAEAWKSARRRKWRRKRDEERRKRRKRLKEPRRRRWVDGVDSAKLRNLNEKLNISFFSSKFKMTFIRYATEKTKWLV